MAKGKKKSHPKTVERQLAFDCFRPGTLSLDDVDLGQKAGDDYDERLEQLQTDLFHLQIENFQKGGRAVFAFEGWDAAGKGGVIKRLTAKLDPRGYKVWPIAAPKDEEARQHYLWRFWTRLPQRGEIAIFDRSWYGRVLVERVEGFCKKKEWERAYDEINAFERTLTQDGVRMVKFWLHISPKTQLERFRDRETDPFKRYKIGDEDWRNRKRWDDHEAAVTDMFDKTHRPDAPWRVVAADDKKFARLDVLRSCIAALAD